MNTLASDLFFKKQDEAQAILNANDPGYEIAITKSGMTFIVDENKNVVLTMTADAGEFNEHKMLIIRPDAFTTITIGLNVNTRVQLASAQITIEALEDLIGLAKSKGLDISLT
jgi:hypothetical protein